MNIIVSTVDYILNWSRANSLWPFTFATSCCGIELMQTTASDNDIARFGSEVFRNSPRQADLLICAGTITHKMAPVLLTNKWQNQSMSLQWGLVLVVVVCLQTTITLL